MATDSRFALTPSINIGRTRWHQKHDHPTSFLHGRCIPIDCVPVLPGDTFKLTLSSLIRMSTPIVPIMDNIRCNIYSFFVPMRLVWEHTKEFFGENSASAGPQLTTYKIPSRLYGDNNYGTAYPGSVSHYLGKPYIRSSNYYDNGKGPLVSVLKERAYFLIWNEWFRSEQFQNPINVYKTDTGLIASGTFSLADGSTITLGNWITAVLPCNKQFDYFTAATLSPQYGPSVEVPLGDYAPLAWNYVAGDGSPDDYKPKIRVDKDTYINPDNSDPKNVVFGVNLNSGEGVLINGAGGVLHYDDGISSQPADVTDTSFTTNMIVNLQAATAASINTLRAAFAAQRFLERANFGSRYQEYIKVHFGITPPVGLLQVSELIGEHHFNINIQQVLSTADATDTNTTKLGQPGANSTTADKAVIFKKAIVEHGFIMTILTTTHDRHYTQGFLREDLKKDMFEIYHPEFATLGDQSISKLEIYAGNGTSQDEVFGYQEHWAEYRYRPSRASGLLDPNVPNAKSVWTLTDVFASEPDLGNLFIQEDRAALSNCLVTGSTGPDYIADFYFDYDVVRPMPLYSIPGRIDHVGGW